MEDFLTFQNGVMKSICHVYRHEDGRILHLLPITILGEKRYYKGLLDYIGDKTCVYETIPFHLVGENNDKTVDQLINSNEVLAQEMKEKFEEEVKVFNKKIITGDLRKLQKKVKSNLSKVDAEFSIIFKQLGLTAFASSNLPIIYTALAKFLDLTTRFNEIDLQDIGNQKNWILNNAEGSVARYFEIKKAIFSLNPKAADVSKTNAEVANEALFSIESLQSKEIDQRRSEMAELLIKFDSRIAYNLLDLRNKIAKKAIDTIHKEHDEVILLYPAYHMAGIAWASENAGFKLISKNEFEVYRVQTEVGKDEKEDVSNDSVWEWTPSKFIDYDFETLSIETFAQVYRNDKNKVVYLLPKYPIGDKNYFSELLEYIGDRFCIYEKPFEIIRSSLEDYLEMTDNLANSFLKQMGEENHKKLLKLIFTKEVKSARDLVKKDLGDKNEIISRIYHQIENTGFDLKNLNTMAVYVSELLELSFENNEIDYINDIRNRENWNPSELRTDILPENLSITDISENPELLARLQSSASTLYSNLYGVLSLFGDKAQSLEKRRNEFINFFYEFEIVVREFRYKPTEDLDPKYSDESLYLPRNNSLIEDIQNQLNIYDELVIYYTAWHMPRIEHELLGLGLKKKQYLLDADQIFTVFSEIPKTDTE